MKYSEQEKKEALEQLRKYVKAGTTIYTILRHVSASGMMRTIDVFVLGSAYTEEVRPLRLTYWVAVALGYSMDKKRDGLQVGGCGMDMGYHVAYSIGSVVFGRGKEAQAYGYHTGRNGVKEAETDGGYIVKHEWL